MIFSGTPKSYWVVFYTNIKDVFICKYICDTVNPGSLGTFRVALEAELTKILASRKDFYWAVETKTNKKTNQPNKQKTKLNWNTFS